MSKLRSECPLCSGGSGLHAVVDGVEYFECLACDFIFADPPLLDRVNAGEPLRHYDEEYWSNELASARQRAYGSSLARAAEAVLYCTIPVNRFVDVGTGPGYLLDALTTYLPSHRSRFFGVEKFPPRPEERSSHEHYLCEALEDVGGAFECGTCIEVLEHLTPAMASGLAKSLASVSVPGSLFLFNTGLTDYVRHEDPGYLDPFRRGHITCWSVKAAAKVFEPEGFVVRALQGKTWAFVVEMPSPDATPGPIRDRIWRVPAANRNLLSDPDMGDVMYLLGLESARAY